MEITLHVEVADASRVGEARRAGAKLARDLGFSGADAERVSLVVTELGTNLVKHARDGQLLIVSGRRRSPACIDVLSLDRGPGTDDFGEWLRDGYSTTGSPGTGLGAVRRLSDTMDVHCARDVGTAILARVKRRGGPVGDAVGTPRFEVGGISVPIRGETVSGDAWGLRLSESRAMLMLSDGLGHGADASMASAEALRVFYEGGGLGPGELITRMASEMRETRGAAVAVARLEPDTGSICFAGIGNVSAVVTSPAGSKSLVSYNGTVGHQSARVRELSYPLARDALVILHSDGLKSRWNLDDYPGLRRRDPALIAAVLYRDFARGTDDVCVVVAREAREARGTGDSPGTPETPETRVDGDDSNPGADREVGR